MKPTLFGMNMREIETWGLEHNLPAYTARQITDWLYKKHAASIDQMSNLSKNTRKLLSEQFDLGLTPPIKVQVSSDGTKKYLFSAAGNKFIEAAYIPDKDRSTLCISSQAGCKMGCLFCMTGKQGFQGNLTASEILNQWQSLPEKDTVTNLVYMGMGEPMDNLEAVLKSLEILTSEWGFGWSPRRITVSTVGIIPAMHELIKRSEVHLAVSMHTPFDNDRKTLMPVQNVYPLHDVIAALKKYDWSRQRRISFEYIMLKGFNDTPRHANELARILNNLHCRINLIRFHTIPGTSLQSSDDATILNFRDKLTQKGIITTIRASRGQDISAAC